MTGIDVNFVYKNNLRVRLNVEPWEETRVPKVVGSNPGTVYWMDFFTCICCKIVMMFV